jgi:hypothetical protein
MKKGEVGRECSINGINDKSHKINYKNLSADLGVDRKNNIKNHYYRYRYEVVDWVHLTEYHTSLTNNHT